MHRKKRLMMVLSIIALASLYFVVEGIGMHAQAKAEEDAFHKLQREYYSIEQQEREAAETGSDLNEKLIRIEQYPSRIAMLTELATGKILTGIYALLLGILITLILIPTRMSQLIKEKK